MFKLFCMAIKSFTDAEIKNIIAGMVFLLEIDKSDDVKENWKKVFNKILGQSYFEEKYTSYKYLGIEIEEL